MQTEVLEALKSRRSIRKFQSRQIADAELEAVLRAGEYAPTGKGAQSPLIIAVQNKEDIETLNRMNAAIWGKDNPYYNAPTILLVLADANFPTRFEDGCSVVTYLSVAAHAVGLGSCWINREKQMFESEEGKALLQKWGISGEWVGVAGLSLGYIDGEPPKAKARKEGYSVIVR